MKPLIIGLYGLKFKSYHVYIIYIVKIDLQKNNFKNNSYFLNFSSKEDDIDIRISLTIDDLSQLFLLLKNSLKMEILN